MTEVRLLSGLAAGSGEGPLWDVETERLYWVDNAEGLIFRATADGRETAVWPFPKLVTSIALVAGGGVVVVSGRRLLLFDLTTGAIDELYRADGGSATPFNDSKTDRQGRLIVGTVDGSLFRSGLADPDGEPAGGLVRLDHDRKVSSIAAGIGISNGPCFSRDGSVLYCNDSWARRVYSYDYDAMAGIASNRRVVTHFDGDEIPDGATVDDEDGLWIATFNGSEVRRYTPEGELDRRIPVPTPRPTSVMFGGSDLDVLFVTSQGDGHGSEVAGAVPPRSALGGMVFAIHGTGARGLPERRFGA
jgi:L-arabinonolactonase